MPANLIFIISPNNILIFSGDDGYKPDIYETQTVGLIALWRLCNADSNAYQKAKGGIRYEEYGIALARGKKESCCCVDSYLWEMWSECERTVALSIYLHSREGTECNAFLMRMLSSQDRHRLNRIFVIMVLSVTV